MACCSKACQKLTWKKHKKECAELSVAGTRASQQALRKPQLTAFQQKMLQKLHARQNAHDFQGVVDLKVEASAVAAAVWTTHVSISLSKQEP